MAKKEILGENPTICIIYKKADGQMKKFRFGYHLSTFFYCVKIRLLLKVVVTQRAEGTIS